jgi:hypothetical protein
MFADILTNLTSQKSVQPTYGQEQITKLNIYYSAVPVNLGHVACSILQKKGEVDIFFPEFPVFCLHLFSPLHCFKAQRKHPTASIPVNMAPTLKAKWSLCLNTRDLQ